MIHDGYRFDPREDSEKLAEELVKLGVTVLSSQKDVNKVFRNLVEYKLDVDCGQHVPNFVWDIDEIVKFFNNMYENDIKPILIRIVENDVANPHKVKTL